jgi:hypothetical protein
MVADGDRGSGGEGDVEVCDTHYTKYVIIYNVCVQKCIKRVLYNVCLTHITYNPFLYIMCPY